MRSALSAPGRAARPAAEVLCTLTIAPGPSIFVNGSPIAIEEGMESSFKYPDRERLDALNAYAARQARADRSRHRTHADLAAALLREYLELPELRLTTGQVARLFSEERSTASAVLAHLVSEGRLRRNNVGQYVRQATADGVETWRRQLRA
jgi:hypothetical protein